MSFWQDLLQKGTPIVGLSPMDGVTDAPMRYMSAKYGQPDVVFTEFVSVDALAHAKEEQSVDRVMRAFLRVQDVGHLERRPYEIAQVFGHTPELFYQAAVIIAMLGFDGMDINMGCPAHKVEEQGSGAGLIRIPETAKEIVRQAKQGMADFAAGEVSIDDIAVSQMVKEWVRQHQPKEERKSGEPLPVSVKTRIGVDKEVADWWMGELMEVEPAIISLHGRTLKQLYQGSADWEAIGRAAAVVHRLGGHLLGNGDVSSLEDGMTKVAQYGVDGFLIGRAAEGNPGVFVAGLEPSQAQQLAWIGEHTEIYERINKPAGENLKEGDSRWFVPLRKHLAWYAHGFPGAAELRTQLVQTNSKKAVESILQTA